MRKRIAFYSGNRRYRGSRTPNLRAISFLQRYNVDGEFINLSWSSSIPLSVKKYFIFMISLLLILKLHSLRPAVILSPFRRYRLIFLIISDTDVEVSKTAITFLILSSQKRAKGINRELEMMIMILLIFLFREKKTKVLCKLYWLRFTNK